MMLGKLDHLRPESESHFQSFRFGHHIGLPGLMLARASR